MQAFEEVAREVAVDRQAADPVLGCGVVETQFAP